MSQHTEDVKDAVGRENSQPKPKARIERVDDLNSLQRLQPFIAHSEKLMGYCMRRFRDPDTLILRYEKSCVVASIIEHDFFQKVCIIVWAQNPDHFPVRQAMKVVKDWAERRQCTSIVSFLDENGPWHRINSYVRLTGLLPYRMVFGMEL